MAIFRPWGYGGYRPWGYGGGYRSVFYNTQTYIQFKTLAQLMSILGHGVGEEVMEAVMEEDGGWFFKYKIALNR